ncbi:MAG: type II toxin-antitoxin system VapC family toxin [Oscillatoria sp. SIO1A7]|nr:type II toxin-antitoxin system VapC family toxin [Oscillatoria sp. SIO1A7]
MMLLLDSVIIIDHFNNIPAATEYLLRHQAQSVISVITRAEVLVGFEPLDAEIATRFLNQFTTLEMTVAVADLAARLRRQERWRLPDAIQAAFSQIYGLTLVTRNFRDFPPERYDFVLIPDTLESS